MAYFLTELHDRGHNTLSLAESALRGQLARFEPLTTIVADRPVIRNLVLSPRNEGLVHAANLCLSDTVRQLGASDIYVMPEPEWTVQLLLNT